MAVVLTLIAFGFIALASRQLGLLFAHYRLPLISGYLLAGIIAGPFVVRVMTLDEVEALHFLDEVSLAFIAFAAGSELYLVELRSRLRSIAWHTLGQLVGIFVLCTAAMLVLTQVVPFMQPLPGEAKLAIALLTGAVLVARSPSSAIAIINELRAKGPFTRTVLGVTVVMDIVVVTFFAVTTSVVDVLLTAEGFSIAFVVLLALELLLSVGVGLLVGKLLEAVLATHLPDPGKIILVLITGFLVFDFSRLLRDFTHEHLPFEVLLEPLLICMVGSFFLTNYTRFRTEFLHLTERLGPIIFIVFFTLVGDALRLDLLGETLLIAVVIFGVRLVGLFIGSLVGGAVAGDLPLHNRMAWMAYVTQAGIGLGLAREAAVEFPQLGDGFATLIISVIVLSQIVGPPLMNFVIKQVGEAHLPGQPEPDAVRDALILGMGGQAQALARRLMAHHWQVVIADTDAEHLSHAEDNGLDLRLIPEISLDVLAGLVTRSTDALVVMMGDDAANLKACELAYEHFGIPRLIARLNDYAWADRFQALGVQVVYPASAMVNLLDQFVRAPQTAAMLLQGDPAHQVVQITITNPDVNNVLVRDLRLPGDVLVLGLMRDGDVIVPHGYTRLKLNDDMTLIGQPRSLEEVTRRLGF
ncbi:MAG: cation:proton antiporter [Anaerolineae bacterium]|nr:cation:proton antiporter [Anaerolineae bacterium]